MMSAASILARVCVQYRYWFRNPTSNPPPVFQQTNNPTVMQVPQQPAQAGLQPFQPLGDDQEDDRPAAPAAVAVPVTPLTPGGNRGPVFNVFPQPQCTVERTYSGWISAFIVGPG